MTPQKIIYIGEFGHDPDEEGSLLLIAGLMKMGHVDLIGVIANRSPAIMRARLAKGTLEILGYPNIPVIQGTNCAQHRQEDDRVQFAATYLSDAPEFPKLNTFWDLLSQSEDGSVAVVCASGLTDISLLLARNTQNSHEHLALFKQKVCRVSIMGGVACAEDQILLDEDRRVMPAWDATNNQHDRIAEYVYTQLQRMGIELVVVNKHAAYAACVPRDMYDIFQKTGHPVGVRLEKIQRSMIQNLWWRCNLESDSKARDGLPSQLGRDWFSIAFCQGQDLSGVKALDNIWTYIKVFNLYDQLAVMVAIPSLLKEEFGPVELNRGKVKIIGISSTFHQVRDPQRTAVSVQAKMLRGLMD